MAWDSNEKINKIREAFGNVLLEANTAGELVNFFESLGMDKPAVKQLIVASLSRENADLNEIIQNNNELITEVEAY